MLFSISEQDFYQVVTICEVCEHIYVHAFAGVVHQQTEVM